MIIISAMGRNRVIGSGDGMPWEVPEEYQHFLNTVRGQAVIIGRRSFEIFGPTMSECQCIVVTRNTQAIAGATRASNFEEAVRLATQTGLQVYVAGGASIYAIAINYADRMLLSYISGQFAGDAYFPEISDDHWIIAKREDRGTYELVDYRRRDDHNLQNQDAVSDS